MASPAKVSNARFSRRLKLTLAVGAALILVVWLFGNGWVAARFESALKDGLGKQGLVLTWNASSWDPWRGLHMTDLRLQQQGSSGPPVVEIDNLNLSLPIAQAFSKEHRVTRWGIRGSDVLLRDKDGSVRIENVTLDLDAKAGFIEVKRFASDGKGLHIDLNGRIHFRSPGKPPDAPFEIRLGAVRATLATLDFKQQKPFKVTGNFTIDNRGDQLVWKTNLKGEGRDLEWKGVKWESGSAKAVISSASSRIEYDLHTANGATRGHLSREDWKESPFVFKGELRDKADRVDNYNGTFQKKVVTLEHLAGSADLIALSRDVDLLRGSLSDELKFHTFPHIELKNLIHDSSGDQPSWKIASVEVTAEEPVTFTIEGREANARDVSVHAAHDGDGWIIKDAKADILGGTVSLSGRLREKVLSRSRITAKGVRLSELKLLAGRKQSSSRGVISGNYRGNIDLSNKRADGTGTLRLDNAPVLEVPLLDQVYDLFTALIPGVKRSDDGRFEADFKTNGSIVDVSRFEATGGSLTVSAVGKVNLDKRTVSGRARGKLTGLPGLVTSPLSRLLEMDVGGPYDKIRVQPLGPAKLASNTASGTVGVVVDTLEETGKITGTVLSEGIKLPFRLFEKDKQEKKEKE